MKSSLAFAGKFIKGLVLAGTMIEGAHAMHRRNEEVSPFLTKTSSGGAEVVRTRIGDRVQFALTYASAPKTTIKDFDLGGEGYIHLER